MQHIGLLGPPKDQRPSSCTKCGHSGHLTYQCRNFIPTNPNKKVVLDVSSTSSESDEEMTPLTQLRADELKQKLKELNALKKKKDKDSSRSPKSSTSSSHKNPHKHKRRHKRSSSTDSSTSDQHHRSKKKSKKTKERKKKRKHKRSSSSSSPDPKKQKD